jgi:hypothetical protein
MQQADDVEVPGLSAFEICRWDKFIRNHGFRENWLWQYWKEESRPQSQLNKKFLNRFNSKIKAQREIKDLIRNGCPPNLRGSIWWACSGGADKMEKASDAESFENCLKLSTTTTNPAVYEIMKDLHRTFPHSDTECENEDLLPLKNVLLAYSIRNREVGYCQSMNFIAALLLTQLNEEQSFWVLAALIEDILPPNYYTVSMIGCRVDQLV